ncbi:PREDICTED: cadherin-related family member 1-like [Priapulus caudatus]|uniref:Cadherin-related family member 1-like n=1 Tax=Priapulus caudatus TaxID=37621 RepID=A0ABM1F455_PRICU|nr:PREDICTED: cadherin-related family member 1-like [Priapulus caudatus]
MVLDVRSVMIAGVALHCDVKAMLDTKWLCIGTSRQCLTPGGSALPRQDPALVNKFAIDASTGVMTIAEEVDREQLLDINGRFEVMVEVRRDTDVDEWKANATALVYVNVLDINDNEPEFAKDSYTGSILENSPKSVPVTIDQGDIQVYDWDSLDNGTLAITLDGDDGVFSVQPESVVNEGTILLRVLDPTKLDYQLMQSISFQLVATEYKTPERYSGRTNVIVHLIDTNDKFPQWVDAPYYVELYENASISDHVIQLLATDADSGDYGIVYYYIVDTGIDRFVVKETTGLVSVDQPLDRETTDKYYLTVEARDYKGQGNRNSTQPGGGILDVNGQCARVREYRLTTVHRGGRL